MHQECRLTRGRLEARALAAFDVSAAAVQFPHAQQAARLTRCFDSQKKPAQEVEAEFLLTSLTCEEMPPEAMLHADLGYWGIETGLHTRLDVSAGEDRSRVRKRRNAFNLALMRRVAISVAVHWIRQCPNPRKATTSGFFDHMSAGRRKKAFSLVTACHSSSLSNS